MKVPFVSFEPMHNEIEDEMKEVFNDIYSKNIFINGNYCKNLSMTSVNIVERNIVLEQEQD